jgi:sorting nexin-29
VKLPFYNFTLLPVLTSHPSPIGDVMLCSNYRGTSLLCIAYEIFSNILFNRRSSFVEGTVGDYQCGFRQGRSTNDQIFTIRQILEKCNEFQIGIHHLFIDFRSAYDRIDTDNLFMAIGEMHVPRNLIVLVRTSMRKFQRQIKIQNMLSSHTITRNGVRQGHSPACLLFNIALGKVITDADINIRGTLFCKSVEILAFVDDIDIIGRTQKAIKETLKMHLQINEDETKHMPVTKKDCTNGLAHIEIGSCKFEVVHSFIYLRSEINCENDISEEMK